MIYVPAALISSHDQQEADLKSVQGFFQEHGDALANAAYHLGGVSSSGAVVSLIGDLREARRLTASHTKRLERLHALLALSNVGDPDRYETEYFANLVPGSCLVDEICMLTDALDDLLTRLCSEASTAAFDLSSNLQDAA